MPPVAFLLQDTGTIYGAQRATLDLLRGLALDGRVAPVVLLLEETRLELAHSAFREAIRAAGVEIVLVPIASAFSWKAARTVRAHLRQRKISVLHTVGPKADLHGWLAADRHIRQVSTVHGWLFRPDPKERLHEILNRWVLRRCHRVIALSRYYESLLLDSGVRRDRLVRIPSGFSAEGFGSLADRPDFTAGWMGRFSEEKQLELFLRAVALAAPRLPGARFLIAGDGPLKEPLRNLADSLGIQERLEWSGYLAREVFFDRVALLVMTSKIENLPYTILEAMSAGRPVIATEVGGIPDLVEDGVSGFLVPAGDVPALAERIVELSQNPARAGSMSTVGREKLGREFSLEAMVQGMVGVYEA